MEPNGSDRTQELLQTDIDAIIHGKKSSGRKSLGILLGIVIVAAVVIIVFAVHANQMASLYQDAMAARDSGDYEAAVSLFTELGDYKDSVQQAALSQEASEIVSSKIYYTLETNFSADCTISYDVDTRTVTCAQVMDSDTIDNLSKSASLRKSWKKLCNSMDEACESTTDRFAKEGFDGIVVVFSMARRDTGEIVYSTTDGVSTYNCLESL
jgi:hypothetical protein